MVLEDSYFATWHVELQIEHCKRVVGPKHEFISCHWGHSENAIVAAQEVGWDFIQVLERPWVDLAISSVVDYNLVAIEGDHELVHVGGEG